MIGVGISLFEIAIKNPSGLNNIGAPGDIGFGVGTYPGALPSGFTKLTGTDIIGHDNYGNYDYKGVAIMVWIPIFYYKMTPGNIPLIMPEFSFPTVADANTAGYALHRAFYDGGEIKRGFFVDKYMCSKVAAGTGFVAGSVKNGLPISTNVAHNPIADITAAGGVNAYYAAIDAVKGRGDVDGAYDSSSLFFCCTRQIYAALALLSLAHAQAVTSVDNCAWYDSGGVTNFPKGCNNNALGDANDPEISYVSDGYSNSGKTGSGTPFAKTTHNGQACGIADLNGLMWEVSIGITCETTTKSITGITQGNPAVVTAVGHGRSTGDVAMITGVVGMTQVNDRIYNVTVIDSDTLSLDNCDSTGFTAYTSGGIITSGDFYTAKTSTAMKNFTSGTTLATDHWGVTGIAAMMDSIVPPFQTVYPTNGFSQRFGNGANEVFSGGVSGNNWNLTGLGLPDSGGISSSGANVVGQDFFYQYMTHQMALLSGGAWAHNIHAGPWAAGWHTARSNSYSDVGFRAAAYL